MFWVLLVVVVKITLWCGLQINDAEDERSVERNEKARWVQQQGERADQKFLGKLLQAYVPFFVFGMEGPVTSRVSEALGLVDQFHGRICLVNEEDV
jgi:hypothetical protein